MIILFFEVTTEWRSFPSKTAARRNRKRPYSPGTFASQSCAQPSRDTRASIRHLGCDSRPMVPGHHSKLRTESRQAIDLDCCRRETNHWPDGMKLHIFLLYRNEMLSVRHPPL